MQHLKSIDKNCAYDRTIKLSDTELPWLALYNMVCGGMKAVEDKMEEAARAYNAEEVIRLLKIAHDHFYVSNLILCWSADDAAREADIYEESWNYHLREHVADDSNEELYEKFVDELKYDINALTRRTDI